MSEPRACTPELHGTLQYRIWDVRFKCWRCTLCGHRTEIDGKVPKQTRYMWPWWWRRELRQRRWALDKNRKPQRRSTDA